MESCEIEFTYRKPKKIKNFKVGDRVHRLDLESPKSPFRYWSGVITDICRDYFLMKEDTGGQIWVRSKEIDLMPENEKAHRPIDLLISRGL